MNIWRKTKVFEGKLKYLKKSKNICRETKMYEGKQKKLEESKFHYKRAKAQIYEGKQKCL